VLNLRNVPEIGKLLAKFRYSEIDEMPKLGRHGMAREMHQMNGYRLSFVCLQYTSNFNGTSGASPIVAGAAVLLQSWTKHRTKSVYSPEDMRDVLTSPAQNTTSANPASDRIGVMPNLRGIIEFAERFHYEPLRYMSLVYILFGLIDDGPGAVWVPGKGPVPVDPGWGRLRRSIPAHKRDLLGALAINEIAQMMDDPGVRTRLSGAAVDAMRDAVERVARMG
jgi:hypothetical protein